MGPQGPSTDGWRVERDRGLVWLVCDALTAVSGLGHAFSTRVGPDGDEFDLGAHDDSGSSVQARRRRLCRAAGLDGQRPLLLRQVHGNRVASGTAALEGEPLAADGIFRLRGETPGFAAAVRTADCVPILLADTEGLAVAAVHSGWRGTAKSIAVRAVAGLESRGVSPGNLVAAIGPAIGPCCYEVGEEVAGSVARALGVAVEAVCRPDEGARNLDLSGAIRRQLHGAGLPAGAVHSAPWCTACHADLFYSYRRDGGPTGRLMACIGWAGESTPP